MNSKNTKSSSELQRDVRKELNNVNREIDRIQGRMTPGQFIDDAIFYPHGANPRMTFDHLKSNPVGTTFLAVGTMLLMEDETHRTYESSLKVSGREAVNATRTRASGIMADAKDRVEEFKGKVDHAKDNIKGKVSELKDKVSRHKKDENEDISGSQLISSEYSSEEYSSSTGISSDTGIGTGPGYISSSPELVTSDKPSKMDQVKGRISDTKDSLQAKIPKVKENLSTGMDKAKNSISGAMDSASQKFDSAKESIESQVQEGVESIQHLNPLTYIALGAGLGTLSGAALPVSEKEKQVVNDKFGSKMQQFSQELQDALNESVNVMKEEFLAGFKDFDLGIFKGSESNSDSQNI